MTKSLLCIPVLAALAVAGCCGYPPHEARFNDMLVARATLLAELAKEDAKADAALLGDSPASDAVRRQLERKIALADQVIALTAALYERTHRQQPTSQELTELIRQYQEKEQCPTSQPAQNNRPAR